MPVRHYDIEGYAMSHGDKLIHVPTGAKLIYLNGLDDGISSVEYVDTHTVGKVSDDDLKIVIN